MHKEILYHRSYVRFLFKSGSIGQILLFSAILNSCFFQIFSRVNATLEAAMSVGRSVGRSVGLSVRNIFEI